MTFPCLVCGDLPVVDQPAPQPSFAGNSAASTAGGVGARNGTSNATPPAATKKSGGGATIRTLSKEISDKIFQNLCRHLYVKTEPYWFIQNPGEQMPLCAFCSGVVLEMYTLQTKMDQFQAMIKKLVWKLERIVADTEIATNWMATREEQESEEEKWNGIPIPPMAIRIARERHHKFRQQILENFKRKVKLRQKMRAAGQHGDEMYDVEPTFFVSMSESMLDSNGTMKKPISETAAFPTQVKRSRLDETLTPTPAMPSLIRGQLSHSPLPARASPVQQGTSRLSQSSISSTPHQQYSIKTPSSISVSTVGTSKIGGVASGEQIQEETPEYSVAEDSEMDDDQESQQIFRPDVQIVCSAGPADYFKEEQDYSNSGDGDDSIFDGNYWGMADGDDEEAMSIRDGEDAVWLASGLALRKSFVNQLLAENLKPSVFLRKLVFAVFGMKQVANSSGISGSNKPGAKPSLDRFKFEALREYTIETYGIRDNIAELEDLNRKIRTICCDARKALKRKILKTTLSTQNSNVVLDTSTSSGVYSQSLSTIPPNIPDLFHLSSTGASYVGAEDDDDNNELNHDDGNSNDADGHLPVSVSMVEENEEEDN